MKISSFFNSFIQKNPDFQSEGGGAGVSWTPFVDCRTSSAARTKKSYSNDDVEDGDDDGDDNDNNDDDDDDNYDYDGSNDGDANDAV